MVKTVMIPSPVRGHIQNQAIDYMHEHMSAQVIGKICHVNDHSAVASLIRLQLGVDIHSMYTEHDV
jgi:hypothetical protein